MTRMALVGAVDRILALSPFFKKDIPSSFHSFLTVPETDLVTSSCAIRREVTIQYNVTK